MKKIFCLISSIILSIVFIFFSLVLTDILFTGSSSQEIQNGAILLSLLSMSVCILLIELVNRYYDASDGFHNRRRSFGRWAHNCLFIALVLCFAYVLIATIATSSQGVKRYGIAIILCIVIFAVIYYMQNYQGLRSRRDRILSLERNSLRYKRRRYYFLSDRITFTEEEVEMKGLLRGKIHANDEIYIYIPASSTVITRIRKILVNGNEVSSAQDEEVEIIVKKDPRTETIRQYAVVSSVRENETVENVNFTENPFLNGLILGYEKCNRDPAYMSTLLWEASGGEYLLAGKSEEEKEGDIMDIVSGNVNAAFPSVSAGDTSLTILPVFTDWHALSKWKLMMEESNAMTIVMKYQEIVDIMHEDFDGIVINPFGPAPFFMPHELADSLMKMRKEAEEGEE